MSSYNSLKLFEIANISAGGDVPKKAFSKEKKSGFTIPIVSNGIGDEAIYGYTNIEKISEPCVTIAARGTIGYAAFRDEPFYPIVRLICVIPNQKKVIPKYLYYYLSNTRFFGTTAGISQLTVPMVSKNNIKIPDLETQRKIVEILDQVATLRDQYAKLSELEVTKLKTLKYELLYTKNQTGKAVKLKDLFDFKTGYTPSKSIPEYWDNGSIPWFRMEDIRKNGRILSDSIQHVSKSAIKGKLFPANSIIMSTTATIGEYALLTSDSLANQQFTFLTRKVNCCDCIDIVYFYHYCSILSEWCKRNVNSGGLLAVDMKAFENYKMKLPAIDEQVKIAKILSMQEQKINCLDKMVDCVQRQYKYLLNHLLNGDFDLGKIRLEEKEGLC